MANNPDGRVIFDTVLGSGMMLSSVKLTLGADLTLTAASITDAPKWWVIDPGGAARKVLLPAAAEELRGHFIIITNAADADEELNVRDSADAVLFGDLERYGGCIALCDGTTWWAHFFAIGAAS